MTMDWMTRDLTGPTAATAIDARLPAEWEPIEAVWVDRPRCRESWWDHLSDAQKQWQTYVEALARVTRVRVLADEGIATDDAWLRDTAPIFTHDRDGRVIANVFRFNAWGDKYSGFERDRAVATRIAEGLGLPVRRHDFVLEGGAIDADGRGTLLTTEQCLLNPNRNPGFYRARIEQALSEALGASRVIWLRGGISGDDTDGHVDDVARFLAPGLVAAAIAPTDHPDHAMLERNLSVLREARDVTGQPFELLELSLPDPMPFTYPAEDEGRAGRTILPATYVNFLICNGTLFVPVFGQRRDDEALRRLDDAMPHHRIEPIRAEHLVVGSGTLHCLSMQQPRPRSGTP